MLSHGMALTLRLVRRVICGARVARAAAGSAGRVPRAMHARAAVQGSSAGELLPTDAHSRTQPMSFLGPCAAARFTLLGLA